MPCSVCGTENEAGRKFCLECGAALARVCPACSTPNAAGAKFCGECGAGLGDVAAVAGRAFPPTLPELFWVAVTGLQLAEVLFSTGRAGEAEPVFDEARGIFVQLHAEPWLQRLEQARHAGKPVGVVPA